MNQRNRPYFSKVGNVVQTILVLVLIGLILMMMAVVSKLQGTARVINYAGIVRGATQRLVKLEISDNENQELEDSLNGIIDGLMNGSADLRLVKLDDSEYQLKLNELNEYWGRLKKEIEKVRAEGAEQTDILDMSEEYFKMADDTVSAAEIYSQNLASSVRHIEIIMAVIIACIILNMILQTIEEFRLAKANKALSQKAYIDLHTGLPNKSRCEEILKIQRNIDIPTCCVMFDMNCLKQVNDTLGHAAGDTIIANFANILRKVIPENDFVGRYGGDEFIAIIRDTSKEEVEGLLKKVDDAVKYYNQYGQGTPLSYANGYAMSDHYQECTLQVLLEKADHNMYLNKMEYKKMAAKKDAE
ncbi:MAG: diguanylate cyclase [Clostridia bacterium]|nr:diguanylate cyclase [Clostridia bacterium]NCC43661.1 diguanylate cyclase [Clostridia bacterium]